MSPKIIYLIAAVCLLTLLVITAKSMESNPFENSIQTFENWDKKNSFPENAVLFVGSSSIVKWKTHEFFREMPVINRGFGGSQISDINYYVRRIVLPYKPKVIVFYAGDNDIAAGKSATQVADNFMTFVGMVHKELPKTTIIYISMKYCSNNYPLHDAMKEGNGLIDGYSKKDSKLIYFDGASPLLGEDGKPNDYLFESDRHHLNDKGYEIWSRLLKPIIQLVIGE